MAESTITEQKITREQKLKAIGLDETLTKRQLSDKILDNVYEKFMQSSEKIKDQSKEKNSCTYITKPKINEKVDKDDKKYKITLKFLNKLLVTLGKEEIDNLTKFKDIKRDDLLKEECDAVLFEYIDEIAKNFGKKTIRYELRHKIDSYLIAVIRRLSLSLGYEFHAKKKETTLIRNNVVKRPYWLVYSIK